MTIKEIAKRTYAYQYYWCVKNIKRGRDLNTFSSFLHAKPLLYKTGDKVGQFDKLMQRVEITNCGYGNFFYSIDENCIPYSKYKIIENIPVDYNKIIFNSLEDLIATEQKTCNVISNQNIRVLRAITNYIDRASKNCSEARVLINIKRKKASTLEEALQRILLINQCFWQTGHKLVGLGRLDKLLDTFPECEDEEELIKDFLKTLHEHYKYKSSVMPGDTGQIILLGGKEVDGSYFSNRLTYSFINCLKELYLPDPKILLRVSDDTPTDLLKCAAECIATGIGSPLLSNDNVVINDLIDFGYSQEDAFNYGVSACWEPLAIGKSLEQNNIWSLEFGRVVRDTIESEDFLRCNNFEDLLHVFKRYLAENVETALNVIDSFKWERDPLFTLFTEGCKENDLDISEGGAKYNDYGLLSEGMSSAVNSLLNIKRNCFEREVFTLSSVRECVLDNYSGQDSIRELFSGNEDGFGTDDEEAVMLTNNIIEHTVDLIKNYRNSFGGCVKFGLSSPNYISKGCEVKATADGRLDGMPFDTHISRDKNSSPTEIMNFASNLKFCGYSSNANVVDVVMQSSIITENIEKFILFLQSIINAGIFQIQFNILSYKELVDAKAHPEKHPNLIVRVWGFSAYFNDLPEEYQNRLIERAKEMEKAA